MAKFSLEQQLMAHAALTQEVVAAVTKAMQQGLDGSDCAAVLSRIIEMIEAAE